MASTETQITFNTMEYESIVQMLKEHKFRITPQRRVIIQALVHTDCSTVKDIYFEASRRDKSIGIATVYRMVRVLEELGVLKCSTIDLNHECVNCHKQDTIVFLNGENQARILDMPKWMEHLKRELKRQGMLDNEKISVVVRKSCNGLRQCEECENCDQRKEK